MATTRRIRLELDSPSYEAVRYFGLLRGVPVGSVMRRAMESYARTIQQEFPAVRAHVLAKMQAYTAMQELQAMEANRVAGSLPDPDDVPF